MLKKLFGTCILILSCSLLLVACSDSDDDNNSSPGQSFSGADACEDVGLGKIANGRQCTLGDNPANSPVIGVNINSSNGSGVCSGTVIADNWVLTAAHCFLGDVISVSVVTPSGSVVPAAQVIPNPDFTVSGNLFFNDVALIRTTDPVRVASSALLLSRAPQVGEKVTIAGFGEIEPGVLPGTVYAGEALITNVSDDHVTISFESDQAHPCGGDSGSALFVKQGGGLAITGVVSQSDPSVPLDTICRVGDITLYTNTQKSSNLSFITQFVPGVASR